MFFTAAFLRQFIFWTWWLGAVLGLVIVRRRGGGALDMALGLVAGAVAGVLGAATLGCLLLFGEIVPHMLWGGNAGGVVLLVWIVLVLAWWTAVGAVLGLVLGMVPAWRHGLLEPLLGMIRTPLRTSLSPSGERGRG